ncbi:universal stress protein [Salinarchaeum laminariae]|uniref:universal stress protein n=1 Tax=Salinarchaeum laminariae TaxID=869888 RepID=UPI0020BDF8A8|nr:universal stress protein [Salinarchaeum laminariae]
MYDDVLLPTDGSDGTTTVAAHAASLAQANDARIHVLSVADARNRFESPSSGLAGEAWEEAERERATAAVDTVVAALPEDAPVEREVVADVPHEAILERARDGTVDAIVMGTHGRTGLDHYLIGSVAERVVRQSPVPVMTVRVGDGE